MNQVHKIHRARGRPLGLLELIAIALGGMVGGGIFAILGISVEKVGNATPLAIMIGGVLALLAAYSYAKLAKLYQDEGATYSFFKRTFPQSHFAASAIGWYVVFGYISTLALYAFTFASYLRSVLPSTGGTPLRKLIAAAIILFFMVVNLVSVRGMGKLEDLMVYTKIVLLLVISGLFIGKSEQVFANFHLFESHPTALSVLTVTSLTFVAFEGFQLTINAFKEAVDPVRNIPRSIYISVVIVTVLYVLLASGAILTIPSDLIIRDKEFALASGATKILGRMGLAAVISGALLATSSAISGTLFGASRLVAVIAEDGYLPEVLSKRSRGHIPHFAVIAMSVLAYGFILIGGLETILEYGSITFILVSFLMAYANFRVRDKTDSALPATILSMAGLLGGAGLILYYEARFDPKQIVFIASIYGLLTLLSWIYSRIQARLAARA